MVVVVAVALFEAAAVLACILNPNHFAVAVIAVAR